ncbi:hypothetical protein O5344_29250 [Escherichia coli]|nr:hypothetical protein [Escherichia coli]
MRKGKTRKNKMLQKSTSRTLAKTPLNPVEIQYSCGFGAYHLSKNRAYVLNLATVHFRFLAHLLANARSLGLRRAEPLTRLVCRVSVFGLEVWERIGDAAQKNTKPPFRSANGSKQQTFSSKKPAKRNEPVCKQISRHIQSGQRNIDNIKHQS